MSVASPNVILRTRAADAGLTLVEFQREGAAREVFEDATGRQRAIAPDARIVLRDEGGRRLVGNVELDLGTMSHARLRKKLEGYLAHAERGQRGGAPPALLFITIGMARAETFLRTAGKLAASERWRDAGMLRIAASDAARRLDGLVSDPCWRGAHGDELRTLRNCLVERHLSGV